MEIKLLILVNFSLSIFLYLINIKKELIHIDKIYMFGLMVFFVLPSIYISILYSSNNYYYIYPEEILISNIVVTIVLISVICSTFFLDFFKVKKNGWDIKPSVIYLLLILLFISYISKFQMILSGAAVIEDKYAEVTAVSSITKYFSNFDISIFPILCALYFGRDNKTFLIRSVFLLSLVIMISYAIFQGRRFGIIYPVIVCCLIYCIFNKINLKKMFLLGSMLFFCFFIMTSVRITQAKHLSGHGESISSLEAIQKINSDSLTGISQSIISRIGNPFIMTNHTIYKRYYSDDEPFYQVGEHALLSLIPRALYSEKGQVSIGNEFGKELSLISSYNNITKINPGWPAEVIYSYGILGVFPFFLLVTAFIKILYKTIDLKKSTGVIIYTSLFTFAFSGFQMEFSFAFNTFVKTLFVLLLISFVYRQKSAND